MTGIAETKGLNERTAAINDFAAIRRQLRGAAVPENQPAPDEDCPGCGWSPAECHCTGDLK
jgi:hypothetical protein